MLYEYKSNITCNDLSEILVQFGLDVVPVTMVEASLVVQVTVPKELKIMRDRSYGSPFLIQFWSL